MSHQRGASDRWSLNEWRAALDCDGLQGTVDLERPTRGLHQLRLQDEALDGWLMAVGVEPARAAAGDEAPWTPVDCYVRGSDLVATYREPLGEPFNLQIYWRALEPGVSESAVLEAILSVQTHQWEAYPCVTVSSALAGDATEGSDWLVIRSVSACYAEVIPPGDFARSSIDSRGDGLGGRLWKYDRPFMERGVIRRLRVRGGFVARDDASAPERLRAAMLREEPPLTV